MNNTMTAHAAEPINYLDSIINEEEKRCEYGHQWRNFTISRSGRFKSKNKKREIVDGKLFDASGQTKQASVSSASSQSHSHSSMSSSSMSRDDGSRKMMGNSAAAAHYTDYDKYNSRYQTAASSNKAFPPQPAQQQSSMANAKSNRNAGGRSTGTFKSFYETNL